ncbi:MAG TPA: sugar porter family MFS transporter [Terracidiphilus sp.]|jgi:sugar porter (SP) family MFS transporter|nr:sugar porter family MFS transporter [Terracidiphilus sp.]
MIPSAGLPTTSSDERTPVHAAALWLAASAGALGGLLFGYDWVVIGGAKPFYERYFHLDSPAIEGWAMSCALIGCLFGAMASGVLTERFGRKRLLTVAALTFALSSLGTGLAEHFAVFVVWRVLGGCAIGLASGISPMYIAEISPAHLRGRLVSLNQVAIVFGILLAQVVNWRIARPVPAGATANDILLSWNGQWGWRWMFGVTAIPSLLFLVTSLMVPESPRWLAVKGRTRRAFAVLERLGGNAYAQRVMADIATAGTQERGGPLREELRAPGAMKLLLVGVVLAVLQQWCGINVIFNYAQEIFAAAGYQVSDILFNIVVTGAVNVVFTFVAFFTIDRFGRRFLLLTGLSGLVLIYALLGLLYRMHLQGKPMLVLVLAAIACYAMSLAPATWVVIAEIFPNRMRSGAMAIAVTALWLACFLLTYTFPLLNAALGAAGTFWTYAGVCLAGALFLAARLHETKGRTLEEMGTAESVRNG